MMKARPTNTLDVYLDCKEFIYSLKINSPLKPRILNLNFNI